MTSFFFTYLSTNVLSNSFVVQKSMEQKTSTVGATEWPKPTKDCILTNKGKYFKSYR